MDWLPYSVVATVLIGVSMSLYKMPSFRGYSSFHSTFWTNIFSLGFSILFMGIFTTEKISSIFSISWLALLWGGLFAATMLQQKLLLKRMETNTLLPITSSLGAVITVLGGIVLFSERLSLVQTFGILIIFVSVFLFSRKKGELPLDFNSIGFMVGIITVSTLSKFVLKLGAMQGSIYHYNVYQCIGAALFALMFIFIFERKDAHKLFEINNTWRMSLLIALFSALGGLTLLKALSLGPVSAVFAIHPAYIFISGIVGMVLYKENLTLKKIILAILTIVGVVLIKIG